MAHLGNGAEEDHWQICKSCPHCICKCTVHRIDSLLTSPQSASYSSTAGVLHTPNMSSYAASRPSDASIEQRAAASPRSTSSSAASHGHAYAPPAMPHNVYSPHGAGAQGLGVGPPSDLRLSVPTSAGAQTTSWHQPAAHYNSDLAGGGRGWDFGGYLTAPATGLPGTAHSYPYQQRIPSLTGPAAMPSEARFVPLHDYESQSQPTSTS